MGWRTESIVEPIMGKEERTKQYIKEELKRRYMYHERVMELREEIKEFKIKYREMLNDPPIGGSIIKMPDGTPCNKPIVMRMRCKLNSLEANLDYYEDRLDTLDKWIEYITPTQQNIVKKYIVEYQCQSRHIAAAELRYSEETVKKQIERAINKIYNNFKKFM